LLQAGVTYDTSPVSKSDRTADLPVDRQIQFAVGTQYQWSENARVGGAIEYIDLGKAKIDNSSLQGEFDKNRIVMFALNLGYQF
jgi:long-subunit fatty acid transport protein